MRPEAFNKYPGSLRYRAGPVRERSGWSAASSGSLGSFGSLLGTEASARNEPILW